MVAISDCANAALGRGLVADLLRDRKHHAPQAGNLEQEVPAHRIGDIAHRDQVRDHAAEIVRRADDEEPLRPGEAFELDAERAAHLAAGAVGADQPARGAASRSRHRARA